MSRSFPLPSFVAPLSLAAFLGSLALARVAGAQTTTNAAAPPSATPTAPAATATDAAPSSDADVDAEVVAPAAVPTAPGAPPVAVTAHADQTPPAVPAAAPPANGVAPTVAPAASVNPDASPSQASNGSDSVLASAGYPLTPGVSALPIHPGFVLSGYLQTQFESHQDSLDQLQQGGALLNQNRFLVRRGRIRVGYDWDFAQLLVELDGNTVRGPAMRLQKAEASLIYGRSHDRDQPPLVQLTLGQFDLPFGFEVPYSPRVRWFMERSQASRAMFPSEPDVGARLSGGISFARYSLAVTNGEPLDEKSGFGLQDPNSNKDITARFGAEAKATPAFVLAGGISYNRGRTLSPGASATKNSVQWTDTNGSGKVDPSGNELVGQPAAAALVSKNFDHWAIGADLEVLLRTRLGWSMLSAEVVAASNQDRGLYVADPVQAGSDVRELGYYSAFTQELTRHAVLGVRYDAYDPNSDRTDQRRGKIVPTSQQIRTFSVLGGLVIPGSARLILQYDIIRDSLARNTLGVPTDLANNQVTLRLQVNP